jgi:hypothetical protein
LAEIVKMSPSPSPAAARQEAKKMGRNGSSSSIRNGENSAAAQAIPNPKHIPWLETGERANKAYLKARQEAIKHGGLRNKFLQRYVPISGANRQSLSFLCLLVTIHQCGAGVEPERRTSCKGAQSAWAERK